MNTINKQKSMFFSYKAYLYEDATMMYIKDTNSNILLNNLFVYDTKRRIAIEMIKITEKQ